MKKRERPPQIEGLLDAIKKYVKHGKFRFSEHAIIRRKERSISPQDAIYVLKNGYHEKKKTAFDELNKTWKYAIRGKTIDKEDIHKMIQNLDFR